MRYTQTLRKVLFTGSRSLASSVVSELIKPGREQLPHPQEYPIFLMHGFMGFNQMKLLGIPLFDYFNGVKALLEQMGYIVVVDSVKPIDNPMNRANEWANHLNKALAKHKAEKVHIIAHSQGCIDARILAAPVGNRCPHHACYGFDEELAGKGYGDRIASMTFLGGPHLGTPLANPGSENEMQKMLIGLLKILAKIDGVSGENVEKTINMMSRDYMISTFNPHILVPDTIPCYTVAGNPGCKHHVSMLLEESWEALEKIPAAEGGGANDGFVPVTSAHYGGEEKKLHGTDVKQWQALGTVTTDHVGLIGLPLEKEKQHRFAHLPMYAGLAQYLDPCYRNCTDMTLLPDGQWERSCKPGCATAPAPVKKKAA